MKVDTTKLKKGSSDLSPECRLLIDQIINCRTRAEYMQFLETIQVWIYGKCELYHWIEILDRFDKFLEEGATHVNGNEFVLNCDTTFSTEDTRLLLLVLNFTTLLIEHSFSRHLYNSIEHLTELLSSQNMDIVLAVLNLLYMFSKRSNFIPRLPLDKKETLLIKLFNIAERWGDPNYGLALIDCCMKKPKLNVLCQLFVEYLDNNGQTVFLEIPNMLDLCRTLSTSEVVKIICDQMSSPTAAVKMRVAHRVRLISGFTDFKLRLQYVQARLQAISVLIYSNALQENSEKILYSGFGEELCELIDKEDSHLVDIRAAVLRTLTSMLHFDRNHNVPKPGSRLPKIIHFTGAERQGGILPLLVRDCILSLTGSGVNDKYPINLATALFSLLYHLASYEAGGQALLKSGMMQSLLCVINWTDIDIEHITFVTRAVRVIDLITNIDIAKFHQNNGLNTFIDRLEKEVNNCREAIANASDSDDTNNLQSPIESKTPPDFQNDIAMESDMPSTSSGLDTNQRHSSDIDLSLSNVNESEKSETSTENKPNESEPQTKPIKENYPSNSYYARPLKSRPVKQISTSDGQRIKKLTCTTQRAALLKSMLNFLKKSIQDHTNFNGMRNIMETSLPSSLRHIISRAEYYGPSLFLLATDVVTVYVFNEPSLLSSLQDYGITQVILQALLQKEVPATREVLGSLPNVFSALCLNERGLVEFMSYEPFDKLLKVLLSPDYLVAMRRRRSSDPLGDTATNLGNAMDDLMKHHPYLRTDATEAIVRLLNELVRLGTDPNFICWRANRDNSNNTASGEGAGDCSSQRRPEQNISNVNSTFEDRSNDNEQDFSADEDDDDEDMSSASQQQTTQNRQIIRPQTHAKINSEEREAIPLIDYILNVMKFIEAIFSNSSNGEHCREFVSHGGLKPLIKLLSLPNLPVDSPVSTTAQAVANVCKTIFNLSHETKVIDIALLQLSQIVTELKPLINHASLPGGSVLLCELLACPKLDDGFCNAHYTPLLHNMSSVHGYVVMLVHICRNATTEMRSMLLQRWGLDCPSGLDLLENLVQLYISLVWESTVLLNLCSDDTIPHSSLMGWDEIMQSSLKEKFDLQKKSDVKSKITNINHKSEKGHSMKNKVKVEEQLRYIKSLLAASSRLGRALAELFGTLVKLSVGTPQSRQRRNNECLPIALNKKFPSSDAKEIATVLSSILVNGFCHESFVPKSTPKLKLTFLICSVGFTGPMLFDDKRNGFHLMISQFCEENGLKAFFNMFYWAISIGNEDKSCQQSLMAMDIDSLSEDRKDDEMDFPEGTGEFLDAWLQLLEKMANPRAIIDSPYALSTGPNPRSPGTVNFEPIFYLVKVHQLAMLAIKRIWKRKPIAGYGLSMTEVIMVILKHVIKSNATLSERFTARMLEITQEDKPTEKATTSQEPKAKSNFNAVHVKILTDMGFSKQHVHEALNNTNSIEQATDYLLNRIEESDLTVNRETENSDSNAAANPSNDMEINLSALPSTTKDAVTNNSEAGSSKDKINILEANQNIYGELKLIPKEVFSKFCFDTLERVFSFMQFSPETVNTGVDLLSVLYRCQSPPDKTKFLTNLVKSISRWTNQVLQNIKGNFSVNRHKQDFVTGMMDTKLFIRFKIATQLLEDTYSDIRKDLCNIVSKENCLNSMIMLLSKVSATLQEQISMGIKPIAPRWLQGLAEFMDAIDSVNVILQRKMNMRAVCSDVWKWYDTSTSKWNLYSEANNVLIRNAFNSGERSVVINIGRQRYTVNFSCMTQVSEASGNHRPVMPALKISEAITRYNRNPNTEVENILTNIIKSDSEKPNIIQQEVNLSLNSLLNINGTETEEAEVQPNTTETENAEPASSSKELKSPTCSLIKMPAKDSSKPNKKPNVKRQKIVIYEEPIGIAKHDTAELIKSIVSLLNPNMHLNFETKLCFLKLCARLTKNHENAKIFVNQGGIDLLLNMKQSCGVMGFPTYAIIIIRHILESPKVLQEAMERVLLSRTGPSLPIGHRDLLFILTQVSSAVARNPQVFLEASKQILRCDYAPTLAFTFDDSKFLVKAQAPANRKDSPLLSASDKSSNISVKVVKHLLYAIVQPCIHYGGLRETCNETKNQDQQQSKQGNLDISAHDPSSPSASNKPQEKYEHCCCSWHIPSVSHNHEKPILPRATILKLLSDAVRSYQCLVPRIIVEHTYSPSDSVLIDKEQTCLSFILENFLPIVRKEQDAEVSVMSRVLISSLVDCYSYAFVQSKVAEEVHKAILRALVLPESTDKHTRLQVLLGLIPTMVESPMLINKVHVQRNNMYRVLLRQGIMSDLAKIAQYSDLSKASTFTTLFATLRPMEILLRLTVAPGALSAKRLLFGGNLLGSNPSENRRFFPRISSRTAGNANAAAFGGENVLRDIIRDVLSDRRHRFEFIFNPEDFIMDGDNAYAVGISHEDDGEEMESSTARYSAAGRRQRAQLDFDRLLDGYMQNERGYRNRAPMARNASNSNGSTANTGIGLAEHHRHSNNLESGNIDNGEGGSDGASTSSEIAAVTVGNIIADVSTSDSNDSDSNISTENDERNEEEEEDEDDDDDDEEEGNEEGADDPSEADGEDETRQFIEVLGHIYERESSETASNDADVDADDEASELGAGVSGVAMPEAANADMILSEDNGSNEGHDHNQFTAMSSQPTSSRSVSTTAAPSDLLVTTVHLHPDHTSTYTLTGWDVPRMRIGEDMIIDGEVAAGPSSNISNRITPPANALSDRYQNNAASLGITVEPLSVGTSSQNANGNTHRRDSMRRLLFLDQQYCAAMPTFNNPTEEGQIELFNQDALFWWLEEAKHLDFESQTNACLYVGHFLIPHLINELKATHRLHKQENANTPSNTTSANRKSAIPVLIQPNNAALTTGSNTDVSNLRNPPGVTVTQPLASPRVNTPPIYSPDNATAATIQSVSANPSPNSAVFVFRNYSPETQSTSAQISEPNISVAENTINETREISTNNTACNQEIPTSSGGVEINTRLSSDESVADLSNENKDAEMSNASVDDESNAAVNADLNAEIQNTLSQQSRSQSSDEGVAEATASLLENNGNAQVDLINDVGEDNASLPYVDRNYTNVGSTASEALIDFPPLNAETSLGIVVNAEAAALPSAAPLNTAAMSPEVRAALGGLEVPDGVDPSFLAALPEEMRDEVIQEYLRMQRVRQRAQQNAVQVAHDSLAEVSPEFLAALPPNIQSEVLLQQRIEQQRQVAQSANPEDPVDAGAFFQNLPDSLRQTILTDMEESQIASLPPELAAEAQYLRRDWENRHSMRLDSGNPMNALRATRGGFLTARFPSSLQNLSEDSRWRANSIWYDANGTPHEQHHHHTTIIHQHHPQFQGKPIALLLMEDENKLLDPDSLATILLFLFMEDSKLNFSRLQRIIRNLCYHIPTREWIINALISIIQRTNDDNVCTNMQMKPQWLNLRVEAVLGYKSNLFLINETNDTHIININPQAAQMIVRNCLEMLFVLAKYFPRSFVPHAREIKIHPKKDDVAGPSGSAASETSTDLNPENSRQRLDQNAPTSSRVRQEMLSHSEMKLDETPSTSKAASMRAMQAENTVSIENKLSYNANSKDFWEVLFKIDINTQKRYANLPEFPNNSPTSWKWQQRSLECVTFKNSTFAKLTEMLQFKVIGRSPQLTDTLIKLMALLSVDLPKDETCEKPNVTVPPVDQNADVDASDLPALEPLPVEEKPDLPKSEQTKSSKSLRKIYSKNYSHLQHIIEVLTHRCGTTEGLDNLAKLIFNMSRCSQVLNGILLQYLTTAILGLAKEVQQSIQKLLNELRSFKLCKKENASGAKVLNTAQVHEKGIMQDRFTTANVVVSAPANIQPSFEIQLPAMKKLLSPTSAQPYFLRTLKILIQVRDLFDLRKQVTVKNKPTLSQIIVLDDLWSTLSECLIELEESKDEYAVLVLQPTVEAFFLIHATRKDASKNNQNATQESSTSNASPSAVEDQNSMDLEANNAQSSSTTKNQETVNVDQSENDREAQLKFDRLKFLSFAEKHRTVLNQILRQSPVHLSDGPFAVLVDHTRILDFDVKRKYFRTELERIDEGVRREESTVSVRRVTVFEDSFRVLYRLGPEEWKNRFYIVFEDEEGQDAGGLLREWYVIISREIFNPMYALFCVSPGDRVTYMINPSSYANPNHLSYFKFVGRVIAKAVHDNKLLECYFTRSFYKHILGKLVKYTDMESQDYEFYKGLDYLMKNNISTLGYELTFSTEVQEFGVTQVRDLIPNGRDIPVTEENKFEYVQLVCQLKMSGSIRQQLDAFLEGFYDIIPKHLISIFNEQELELLISGLPDIDIEDLKANTEYHKYTAKSSQIQWFWRALRSFDQADRAKFLQFVTGTSKVPLQGFRLLEGMNGIQKFQIHRDDRSTDRLPCAHTCFNQLDLPMYKSYEKLRFCLLKAIHECSEGFGFA